MTTKKKATKIFHFCLIIRAASCFVSPITAFCPCLRAAPPVVSPSPLSKNHCFYHVKNSFQQQVFPLPMSSDEKRRTGRSLSLLSLAQQSKAESIIDRQSDLSRYGRGDFHLSADLSDGDVVAYQVGMWYVDGAEVGNGRPAEIRYAVVDGVQIVWTHNCEHGAIRGFDLRMEEKATAEEEEEDFEEGRNGSMEVKVGSRFIIGDEYVEFGPEQLLARLPVSRLDEGGDAFLLSLAEFSPQEELIIYDE